MTGRPRKNRSEPLPVPPEKGSDAWWYQVLPAPPPWRPMLDEDDAYMWMRQVAESGGPEGLLWCFDARRWPQHFPKAWRNSLRWRLQQLIDECVSRNKRATEAAARNDAEKAEQAEHEMRIRAGWA